MDCRANFVDGIREAKTLPNPARRSRGIQQKSTLLPLPQAANTSSSPVQAIRCVSPRQLIFLADPPDNRPVGHPQALAQTPLFRVPRRRRPFRRLVPALPRPLCLGCRRPPRPYLEPRPDRRRADPRRRRGRPARAHVCARRTHVQGLGSELVADGQVAFGDYGGGQCAAGMGAESAHLAGGRGCQCDGSGVGRGREEKPKESFWVIDVRHVIINYKSRV